MTTVENTTLAIRFQMAAIAREVGDRASRYCGPLAPHVLQMFLAPMLRGAVLGMIEEMRAQGTPPMPQRRD